MGRRVKGWIGAGLAAGLLAACAGEPQVALDAGSGADLDAGRADLGPADAGAIDSGVGDAGPSDAGGSTRYDAVLGARCSNQTRSGLLTIETWGGPSRGLNLSMFDRPSPWFGPPELSDAACEFHRASSVPCNCGPDQICDRQGLCVAPPASLGEATVTLTGGSGSQTLRGDSTSLSGQVELTDEALGLRIAVADLEIGLAATALPIELANLDDTLGGTYDQPTSVDVTWSAPGSSDTVYTLVPINHHVGGSTFTECAVPTASGLLHIDGPMLLPLAVGTGLEFQGVQHVRFAAVDTRYGCFELRFTRHYAPSL